MTASMNWLETIPKIILVNLNISILLEMTGLLMSFSHRNLVTSRSGSWKLIWRKVFLMSAMMAVSWVPNLRSNEHKSPKITGPRYKDSFKLIFIFLAFADASYTIISFVVRLFGLKRHDAVCSALCLLELYFRQIFYNALLNLVFNYVVVLLHCFRALVESFDGRGHSSIGKFIIVEKIRVFFSPWPSNLISAIYQLYRFIEFLTSFIIISYWGGILYSNCF